MESDFASAPPGLSESAVFSRARRRAVAERSCQYVYAGAVGTRPIRPTFSRLVVCLYLRYP